MLAEIFKAVIITSCIGGALSLILLMMKPLTERFLGAKWQFYVWITAFIVLVCPLKLENSVQLPRAVRNGLGQISVSKTEMLSVFEDHSGVYMTVPTDKSLDVMAIIACVWLVVAVLLFVKRLAENIRLKKRLIDNSNCCRTFGKVQIRETNLTGAPILLGLIKPVLYVPYGLAESCKMEYVMAHECVHIRRGDIAVKWFAAVVKCIHWFNPLVYIALKQLNQACEISCDAEASKPMNPDQKNRYMQIILEISQKDVDFRQSALALGLSAVGKCLKKRFSVIKKPDKTNPFVHCVGIVIAVILALGAVCTGGIINGNALDIQKPGRYVPIAVSSAENAEKRKVNREQVTELQTETDTEMNLPWTEPEGDVPTETVEKTVAIRGEFNSDGGDTRHIYGVKASENACITVGIRSNTQETVDVYISDAESGKLLHSMGVPVPYEAAYVMEGLEPGKQYDIVLKGTMRNDWNIESEYIIYNHCHGNGETPF